MEELKAHGDKVMTGHYEALSLLIDAKKDFKKTGKPAIEGAQASQKAAMKWGKEVNEKSVDTAKLRKSFKESAKFAAQINSLYPKRYATIVKLRQNLKIHYTDLSKNILDTELLAQSTKDNLHRSFKKLELR